MFENILVSPPIVFIIILAIGIGLSKILSRLAFKPKNIPAGATKPYASGEDIATHMIQPDYSQFFPFAFYFTILHVVALMVALVPVETTQTIVIAGIYILGAIVGLTVLYRR